MIGHAVDGGDATYTTKKFDHYNNMYIPAERYFKYNKAPPYRPEEKVNMYAV